MSCESAASAELVQPSPAARLAVVTCHFNPCGYSRPRENYHRFREALRGARLFTIEASFDGQFHLPSDWRVLATALNLMWQKEALLNAAMARLPGQYDQVAWIDADLLFQNPAWAEETSHLLEQFPVVQLFENCHYADACGVLTDRLPSAMRKRRARLLGHGAPGGAWAARREFLARHGLYARNIVGGGDQVFVDGLFGQRNSAWCRRSSPRLVADWRRWQQRVFAEVRGRVGLTPGDVIHLYHGTRQNRRYAERTKILFESDFDPVRDIRIGANGLLEWASEKPALHRALHDYFADRREDE
jgi:hypothetical protein